MDRAELRRQQKANSKKAVYQYTEKELKAEIDKAVEGVRQKVAKEVTELTIRAVSLALHDEFGFRKKRIERALKSVEGVFVDYTNNRLTAEDVKKWCKEKGIEFNLN